MSVTAIAKMRPAPGLIGAKDIHSLTEEPSRRGQQWGMPSVGSASGKRMWLPDSAVRLPRQ